MATGQVGFKDQKKVKRVYVAKRENPIVNRLNKTKVEKFPDFRQEKEDRAKELRKKDRSVIAARVRLFKSQGGRDTLAYTIVNRQRKKLASQKREKSWHIRGNTLTMIGTQRSKSWLPATRTAIRTGRTISCEHSHIYKIKARQNKKVVSQSSDQQLQRILLQLMCRSSPVNIHYHTINRLEEATPTSWIFSTISNSIGVGCRGQRSCCSWKKVVGLFRHARGASAASKTVYTFTH